MLSIASVVSPCFISIPLWYD